MSALELNEHQDRGRVILKELRKIELLFAKLISICIIISELLPVIIYTRIKLALVDELVLQSLL